MTAAASNSESHSTMSSIPGLSHRDQDLKECVGVYPSKRLTVDGGVDLCLVGSQPNMAGASSWVAAALWPEAPRMRTLSSSCDCCWHRRGAHTAQIYNFQQVSPKEEQSRDHNNAPQTLFDAIALSTKLGRDTQIFDGEQ